EPQTTANAATPLAKNHQSSFKKTKKQQPKKSNLATLALSTDPTGNPTSGSVRDSWVGNREVMACASQALMNTLISANGCTFNPSPRFFSGRYRPMKRQEPKPFAVRASADDADCNVEECAPDKEVGKVSMEWLAGEKTKVVGTFPPKTKDWSGYVEKDTAGQTNIYSVEQLCSSGMMQELDYAKPKT
ncbi:hypothetical protein EUGRSUZ_L03611, partial [Eucalyptus grandis]